MEDAFVVVLPASQYYVHAHAYKALRYSAAVCTAAICLKIMLRHCEPSYKNAET